MSRSSNPFNGMILFVWCTIANLETREWTVVIRTWFLFSISFTHLSSIVYTYTDNLNWLSIVIFVTHSIEQHTSKSFRFSTWKSHVTKDDWFFFVFCFEVQAQHVYLFTRCRKRMRSINYMRVLFFGMCDVCVCVCIY